MKIIKSFVHQIGGEFRFNRDAENLGTRFIVLFPIKN